MNKAIFLSLLRSVLIGIGGVAVGKGWVTTEDVSGIATAVAGVAAAVWEAWDRRKLSGASGAGPQ